MDNDGDSLSPAANTGENVPLPQHTLKQAEDKEWERSAEKGRKNLNTVAKRLKKATEAE